MAGTRLKTRGTPVVGTGSTTAPKIDGNTGPTVEEREAPQTLPYTGGGEAPQTLPYTGGAPKVVNYGSSTPELIHGNTGPSVEQRTTSYIDNNGEKKTGLVVYDKNTDYMQLINEEKAKGDAADADYLKMLESARNAKIYGEGMEYQQTDSYGGATYGEIAQKAEESTDRDYLNSLMDMLNAQYESALAASDQQTAYAIEQARARVNAQIEKLNASYKDTNRQLYADYMRQQKNLPQQLAAMGVTGGLTESTLSGLGTSYADALAGNERARLTNIGDIQSGLTEAEYAARMAAAERAQSLQGQYMSNYAAYAQALQEQANYEKELAYQKQQQERADALNRAQLLASLGDYSGYGDVYGAEYAQQLNALANPVVSYTGGGGTSPSGPVKDYAIFYHADGTAERVPWKEMKKKVDAGIAITGDYDADGDPYYILSGARAR